MKRFSRYHGRVYFRNGRVDRLLRMRVRSPFKFYAGSFYTWLMMAPWQMGG